MNLNRIRDYFGLALESITNRKRRSLLTIVGIFIGIATVVALISIGQGMENAINEQFEQFGTDKILINPGSEEELFFGGGFTAKPLTEEDEKTVKNVRGVRVAAGMITKTAKVEYRGEVKYTFINGIPTGETKKLFEDAAGFKIENGRDLEEKDKKNVVIGYRVVDGFFDRNVRLRDKITINDEDFRVIGTLEEIGNNVDDSSMMITIEAAREIFDEEEEVSMIIAQTKKGFNPADVAEDITRAIRKKRGEKEGEESFNVQTYEQLLKNVGTILGIIRAVLIGIAGISLLVGAVGIMNTMYTAVLERTREIGIMKAIGAKNYDIMALFMVESGIYGLVGGIIGIILGLAMSKSAEVIASNYLGSGLLQASFSPALIFGALAFSFVFGCISGLMPARQAAKLKPVEALRYE